MKFDTTSDKIILISYPSGGFGNFLYYVLTQFAKETVKITESKFDFSSTGDSHATKKYSTIWFKDPDKYNANLTVDPKDSYILVLCDNSINNDSYDKIRDTFPNAQILRLFISKNVRPVVYQTCVIKAMASDLNLENYNYISQFWKDHNESYTQRENFTLLYHNWPFKWEEQNGVINLSIEKLVTDTKSALMSAISSLGLTLINDAELDNLISEWKIKNQRYFTIYYKSKEVLDALETNKDISLSDITDLHDQGYINYLLEKKYNIVIPVYDYKDWFASTAEIKNEISKINEKKYISYQ